jgi:hypothetical protein
MVSVGCKIFNPSPTGTVDPPPKMGAAPKADELVSYLNHNAQMVTSLEAQKVVITAKQADEAPIDLADSLVAYQKPTRPGMHPSFRLEAYMLGNMEVNLGSNSDEFWYWIKRSPYPYVYHCAYSEYPKVAARGAMPFPIQPEWVVEALGVAEYDPSLKFELRESKTTYDLIQRTKSASGDEMVKVIAFHKEQRPGKSQVAGYILYKTTGNAKAPYETICTAAIEDSEVVPVGGGKSAVLPTKIRLKCPKEKAELVVNLGKVQVNQPFPQERVNVLFTRRTLSGYKSYDLARGTLDTGGDVRQAGGYKP